MPTRRGRPPVLCLAALHERLGDFGRAEEVCRQGLAVNPAAADIADRFLTLLERQKRFVDAGKILQQVQIHPRLASAWEVRVALGARDFSRAIDALKVRASNDSQDATSRIQLARLVYQETKDANQARGYLQQAEAIAPDTQALAATRAAILQADGKAAEAQRVLDDYVERHNEFDAYGTRAMYFAEEGQLERAEEDYQELTGFAQNAAIGYEQLSNFYAATGRRDQSAAALEKGLAAYPEDLRLQHRPMQMLLVRAGAGDQEKALGLLAALEKRLPEDPELITTRARQTLGEPTPASLASAREKLEGVVRRQPEAVNAHLMLIGVALRQGEYQAASEYAARALESNAGNPALLAARARAELALGYPAMAFKLGREAPGQDPNNREGLNVMVEAAVNAREPSSREEARRLIELALRREPTSEPLLLSRAHVLVALEASDLKKEAVRLFEHAAVLAPAAMDIRLGLASALYQTGDAAGAEKTYRELLEKYPANIRALNDLAWILQEHGQRHAETLELANKGLRLEPGDLYLLDTRGTILSSMPDRLADARSDFEDLAKRSSADAPRQTKVLFQLGRVCAKLNDLPGAKQYLTNALEIDGKTHVLTAAERLEISRIVPMEEPARSAQ